jgi:hypothetical protein
MPPALESRRHAVALALRAVALEGQVESLTARLREVDARLRAVETHLLETAFEQPAAVVEPTPPTEDEDRVVVPKLTLDEGRMSSIAARALFGG